MIVDFKQLDREPRRELSNQIYTYNNAGLINSKYTTVQPFVLATFSHNYNLVLTIIPHIQSLNY
jgi:hypothetical protein